MGLTPATVAWLEAEIGRRVVAVEPLVGGISSTVVRCVLDDGNRVIVRLIEDREWLAREPLLITQEATALTLLARRPPITPSLVAAGDGVLAMTEVPGRLIVEADALAERIRAMAEAAALIAATPVPSTAPLMPWRSWVSKPPQPPTWGHRARWQDAIQRHSCGSPSGADATSVLLHRDVHPLNLLWSEDQRLPAVVDWINACPGHPHAELGHCRWNLAVLIGVEAADRFLHHYLELTAGAGASDYDPWWDLDSLLDKADGPIDVAGWHAVGRTDLTPDLVIQRTERFLESVLAQY